MLCNPKKSILNYVKNNCNNAAGMYLLVADNYLKPNQNAANSDSAVCIM